MDPQRAYRSLSEIASALTKALTAGTSYPRERVVTSMLEFACRVTGAKVASCRRITSSEEVSLLLDNSFVWSPDCVPVGQVARTKHRSHCQTQLSEIIAIPFPESLRAELQAFRYPAHSPDLYYSPAEIEHFNWIRSEAFVPLMVADNVPQVLIVLGHDALEHFTEDRLDLLKAGYSFLAALFELSEFVEEELNNKDQLLQRVAEVLPTIASAGSEIEFARAVCALMTAEPGFGFDRAMYFHMGTGQLPAKCIMAIGGTSEAWARERIDFCSELKSLSSYIRDALQSPRPMAADGTINDPLFSATCGDSTTLYYHEGRSENIDRFLQTGGGSGGPVLKVHSSDPWISDVKSASVNAVFNNRHDEFFVFRLSPHDNTEKGPIGFVIADLAYHPHKHHRGPGFPNLALVAFTLQLIAGLRRARNEGSSYVKALIAVPILRHEGAHLSDLVDSVAFGIERTLRGTPALSPPLSVRIAKLQEAAKHFVKAQTIISDLARVDGLKHRIAVRRALQQYSSQASRRHQDQLICEVSSTSPDVWANIHEDALETILACIFDNAVKHGGDGGSTQVSCRISWDLQPVPVGGGRTDHRIFLHISNSGSEIPGHLKHFLFAEAVSTAQTLGEGTGLSYAAQLARAYGGDVVLEHCAPPTFGIILTVSNPPITQSTEDPEQCGEP